MKYYVYENWHHEKAIIHKSSCHACNSGKGRMIFKSVSSKWGGWLGPFKDLTDAKAAALKTRRKRVDECYFCFKKKGVNRQQ